MSEKLYENKIDITSFFGGITRGRCIQITMVSKDYEQFDKEEIREIVKILKKWLKLK